MLCYEGLISVLLEIISNDFCSCIMCVRVSLCPHIRLAWIRLPVCFAYRCLKVFVVVNYILRGLPVYNDMDNNLNLYKLLHIYCEPHPNMLVVYSEHCI